MKKKQKQLIIAMFSMMTIGLFGCSNDVKTESFEFGSDLVFTQYENHSTIDLESSSQKIKDKHKTLSELIPDTETAENAVALTTSTANILYAAGIIPIGAPESDALLPELKEKQYKLDDTKKFDKTKVLNIGSALSPNTELIIELNPKVALYSDALMHVDYMSTLENANVNIGPLGQSDYTDMFVLIDVLSQLYNYENTKINDLMNKMISVLKETKTMIESQDTQTPKTIAILQLAGESILVNGDDSVLGGIVKSFGMENVFASSKSVELNQESLISANPDYVIYYSHGAGDEVIKAFEKRLNNKDDTLNVLDAVKNNNAFAVYDDNFKFSGSVDLSILDVIQFLSNKIYT